jgi:hypothetical protein
VSLLARKISRAKWELTDGIGDGEIPADAVTADLKTNRNALSFWTCNEEDLKSVVLALAAGSDRIDKLEIAWIKRDVVLSEGLVLDGTLGNTPYVGMRSQHVDSTGLDLMRLGTVARLISEALSAKQYLRMTMKEVRMLIAQAVDGQRVLLEELKPKVREDIEKIRRSATGEK